MNLTYYPFKPFIIEKNKVQVIQTNNPKVYTDLAGGLREINDDIHLSTADYDAVEISKGILWVGDVFLGFDIDKAFAGLIQKKIINQMSSDSLSKLITIDQQLRATVLDEIFTYDLPIKISTDFSLAKVIKYCDISFESSAKTQPYDIIELLLKTASELQETKVIVLTNVRNYLSVSQFQELVSLANTLDLYTLLVEFSETEKRDYYANCCYSYIDQDFVDWRDE
ncbi:type II-A CRISPR-associated protein Csn2 [Lapidilactobacillus mulanensis]|uniref:Type II-A CRISPR-associated protein Csn2 n=1 Tax=Lapidilactobacillus mulanensis TaxID=2485999 RepID=A0ABW4DNT5_9LACO|nr:type II-A CRISPR-associated protein Csn2 [Lapidilactobacillus mulanensis]